MYYQQTQDKLFLDKWRYQAKYSFLYKTVFEYVKGQGKVKQEKWHNSEEADHIAQIDFFLSHKSTGEWIRYGNKVYVMTLTDIFNLRLLFDQGLTSIKEVIR